MIDLSPYNNLPELTGILNSQITEPLYSQNYQIIQIPKRNWWVLMDKTEDIFSKGAYSDDNLALITSYSPEILNKEFSSILIAGLGLGVMPYICKNNSSCSVVDVVEINQEVIDLVTSIGYLNNINIINDDIYVYEPTITYDIILLDIWDCVDCNENLQNNITTLVDKYKTYLNTNGFIYTPININQGDVIFLK
jgi:hypothetical protein